MRELVIERIINLSSTYDDDDIDIDIDELPTMSDAQLLDIYDELVGFNG